MISRDPQMHARTCACVRLTTHIVTFICTGMIISSWALSIVCRISQMHICITWHVPVFRQKKTIFDNGLSGRSRGLLVVTLMYCWSTFDWNIMIHVCNRSAVPKADLCDRQTSGWLSFRRLISPLIIYQLVVPLANAMTMLASIVQTSQRLFAWIGKTTPTQTFLFLRYALGWWWDPYDFKASTFTKKWSSCAITKPPESKLLFAVCTASFTALQFFAEFSRKFNQPPELTNCVVQALKRICTDLTGQIYIAEAHNPSISNRIAPSSY